MGVRCRVKQESLSSQYCLSDYGASGQTESKHSIRVSTIYLFFTILVVESHVFWSRELIVY